MDALTGICSSAAGRMATARSTALATLKGYDNPAKRDERVAVIMTDIQVPADSSTRSGRAVAAHYLEATRNAMLWASQNSAIRRAK